MVAGPNHIMEMKVKHPLFPEREMKVIPHKYCEFGTGTGFIPVSPAHNETDFEMAEYFDLPTKGYVSKNGKFKYTHLNDDFRGMTIKDEDFMAEQLWKHTIA